MAKYNLKKKMRSALATGLALTTLAANPGYAIAKDKILYGRYSQPKQKYHQVSVAETRNNYSGLEAITNVQGTSEPANAPTTVDCKPYGFEKEGMTQEQINGWIALGVGLVALYFILQTGGASGIVAPITEGGDVAGAAGVGAIGGGF